MQAENVVLKQLVCAYEKTRQDLVGILDAIVRNDPDLIEHLDPRDIQKYFFLYQGSYRKKISLKSICSISNLM